jgi:hypothetical protein
MVYDHVVEQSQMSPGRSGFPSDLIHSDENLNPVPSWANQIKANIYSSIRPKSSPQIVRDWLNDQSSGDQFEYGMDTMSKILKGRLP